MEENNIVWKCLLTDVFTALEDEFKRTHFLILDKNYYFFKKKIANVHEDMGNWNPCALLVWKTVWRLHKKLKIELLENSATSILDTYMIELKMGSQKGICTSMFTGKLFTRAKR